MTEKCPTCGKKLYEKKGYNHKSLKNLVSYGRERKQSTIVKRLIKSNNKCAMDGCPNKRSAGTVLCLTHLVRRGLIDRVEKT